MSTERTEQIMEVVSAHIPRAAVVVSPGHWAYHHPDGQWFAACGTGYSDGPGCGWSSKPHCYPTKEDARKASDAHLAEMIEDVLA